MPQVRTKLFLYWEIFLKTFIALFLFITKRSALFESIKDLLPKSPSQPNLMLVILVEKFSVDHGVYWFCTNLLFPFTEKIYNMTLLPPTKYQVGITQSIERLPGLTL